MNLGQQRLGTATHSSSGTRDQARWALAMNQSCQDHQHSQALTAASAASSNDSNFPLRQGIGTGIMNEQNK